MRLMTLSKSGMDSVFSSTKWRNSTRSQSTSGVGVWAIFFDSLGVSEVKKSVMSRWEQLTVLSTDRTSLRMRDLNAVLADS